MSDHQIIYAERPPRDELTDWIQCLWTFDARQLVKKHYDHYVPPDGCVAILQNANLNRDARPLIVVGPRWAPTQVAVLPGDFYWGIRCWPFAARALFGSKVRAMTGQVGPLQLLVPELATSIQNSIQGDSDDLESRWHTGVQDILQSTIKNGSKIDALVRRATEEIVASGGNVGLEPLAKKLDVSLRHLQRRFVLETGLGLKQFARIRRFREAARELMETSPRPWCHVALDSGYADQSHLTREFVQLVGLPPRQLQSKYDAIFHDSVDP